jgi:adenylylsulfate kinase-like enzyme
MALGRTGVIDVVEIRLTLCVDQGYEEPRRSQHGKRIAMVSRPI